jgi:hypothetical protein
VIVFAHSASKGGDETGRSLTESIQSSQDFPPPRGQAGDGVPARGTIDFDQFLMLESRYFVLDGFQVVRGSLDQQQG